MAPRTPRLFLALALSTPGLLAQIWVSPTGNDGTGNGTAGNPYKTISFAASVAAPGATLQLTAGTFGDDEQVVFTNKNLTIQGSGVGVTVVKPHPTLTSPLPIGTPPGTPEAHRVAVLVDGPARIDIRQLTIDCDFRMPGTGRLHGLYTRNGGDVTMDSCEIRNVRANPLNGVQGPVAVAARGDNAGDPCFLTVRRSSVHDWGKNGFAINYNVVAVLEDNVVAASGPVALGGPAQNCIQISRGALGIVRNNTVTDSFYSPATVTATGILLFDHAAGTVVEGNRVTRCQSALYGFRSAPAVVATTLRDNQLTESTWALSLFDLGGVTVTGNILHGASDAAEPVYDDHAGNTWSGNNYSFWSGSGPVAIPGGAGNTDTTPRRGCDEFGAPTSVALGGVPVDLVAVDLGGSAALDIATVNEPASAFTQPSLSVTIAGGFPSYTVVTVPFGAVGASPSALVAGEFNGSPGLDLAVVTSSDDTLHVFANNGSGSFSLLSTTALPAAARVPSDLAAADLDGDGRSDLVVATLGGFSSPGGGFVLLNNGSGTAFAASALPGAFTAQCKGVATGRLDAGVSADIALTEGNGSSGRVHLYTSSGAGSFAEVAGSPFTLGADPTSVACDDLDGDGDADVLVASTNGILPVTDGTVTVLRNAFPAFTAAAYRTGHGPQALATGDVGADADPDTLRRDAFVVNFAAGTVTALGAFGPVGFASNQICLAGVTPRAAAVADMNDDGYRDLVVADATSSAVLVAPGAILARGDLFGQGCPGTGGRQPYLAASGAPALPRHPNATFGVSVNNARPLAVSVLIASSAPAPVLAPCGFLLNSVDLVWVAFTTASGSANTPIPVLPPTPDLSGVTLYFQGAIIDAAGGFAGTFALTEGLKVRVGR